MRLGSIIFLVSVAAGIAFASFGLRSAREALPRFGAIPHFSLIDSEGKTVTASSLEGKVNVINFFFSRCKMVCPAVNGRVAAIYNRFQNNENVQFLSVTIDPEYDTPSVLKEYEQRFRSSDVAVELSQWHFLTGDKLAVKALFEDSLELGTVDDPDAHSTRILVVDRSSTLRGLYDGQENSSIESVTSAIRSLL